MHWLTEAFGTGAMSSAIGMSRGLTITSTETDGVQV